MQLHARFTTQRHARRGFTLLEVMLSMFVFLMMTLMFAAVFPFASRSTKFSGNYAQAALIAQHKIDQLRAAGASKLDYTDLSGLGIIDAAPVTGPFSFTATDNIAHYTLDVSNNPVGDDKGFYPYGSTGTVTIADYNTVNSSVPAGKIYVVTVMIKWRGASIASGIYTLSALVS